MKLVTTLVAAALLALAGGVLPTATADHCEEPSLDRNSEEYRLRDVETDEILYYLDVDSNGAVFVYEETNGFDNLQRKDAAADDTCHDMIQADTLVFP